jgi:hypothetical protein
MINSCKHLDYSAKLGFTLERSAVLWYFSRNGHGFQFCSKYGQINSAVRCLGPMWACYEPRGTKLLGIFFTDDHVCSHDWMSPHGFALKRDAIGSCGVFWSSEHCARVLIEDRCGKKLAEYCSLTIDEAFRVKEKMDEWI